MVNNIYISYKFIVFLFFISFVTCTPDYNNPIDPENPEAIPPTPIGLRALPVQNNNTIQILFDYEYKNATMVLVERSIDSNEFIVVDSINFPATSAIDSFECNDTTEYFYRIVALNANGKSRCSNIVHCKSGIYTPVDKTGPNLVLMHEGNPLYKYKTVSTKVLNIYGVVTDPSGIRSLVINKDTVTVDSNGNWNYSKELTQWNNFFIIETKDNADSSNKTVDSLTIYYDVPNIPPRTSFKLKRDKKMYMKWQSCHDLDFKGFAIWMNSTSAIDSALHPDTIIYSSTDTNISFDVQDGTYFGCAIIDSSGNYVMEQFSTAKLINNHLFRANMVQVYSGSFSNENGNVAHVVRDMYVDTTEVTQELYEKISHFNIARFTGKLRPIESLNWFEAIRFCNERSKYYHFDTAYTYDELTGVSAVNLVCDWNSNGFRLPTADEWEYFARAGVKTAYLWGDSADDSLANLYSWNNKNSDSTQWTIPAMYHGSQNVGQKLPNNWMIYDVVGNVSEWVWDYVGTDNLPNGRIDYKGPAVPSCCDESNDGPRRVAMGTYWVLSPSSSSYQRTYNVPERQRSFIVGIRLVQTIKD